MTDPEQFDGYGTALLAAQGYVLQALWDGREDGIEAEIEEYLASRFGVESSDFVDVQDAPFGWLCDYYTGEPLRQALPEELHRARTNNTSRIESQLRSHDESDWFTIDKPPGEGTDDAVIIPEQY